MQGLTQAVARVWAAAGPALAVAALALAAWFVLRAFVLRESYSDDSKHKKGRKGNQKKKHAECDANSDKAAVQAGCDANVKCKKVDGVWKWNCKTKAEYEADSRHAADCALLAAAKDSDPAALQEWVNSCQ